MVYFICLVIFFPFGVLQCMLRVCPCWGRWHGLEGERGQMGWWRKGAVSSCKYSKKVDEVNTKEGTIDIVM